MSVGSQFVRENRLKPYSGKGAEEWECFTKYLLLMVVIF